MRIIQTIASTRLDHGGTSRSVPALCSALVDLSVDNHLVTMAPRDPLIVCNLPRETERVHLIPEPQRFRPWSTRALLHKQLHQLCKGQAGVVVHDHGIWLATNHAVAGFCRRHAIPRVVSPRGMLGSWAMNHGKMKKRAAWWLYQRRDLMSAQAFHVTSDQESEEVRRLGFRQPIVVLPNGIEFPTDMPEKRSREGRQALFLSRVHPKKGLIHLIKAWHAAAPSNDWRLVIAGPDEGGHREEVESEITRLGRQANVSFVGNVEGDAKWQLYVDSDLFILPSFNENFGIVIAEAMASGLPVITTTSTPWSVIREKDFGWWIAPELENLTVSLRQALSCTPEQLRSRGARAAMHVRTMFEWKQVAEQLSNFYELLFAQQQQHNSAGTERVSTHCL